MKTKYRFSEGRSLNYLVHSIGVLVVSAILSAIFTIYILPFGVAIMIGLLAATTGVELDLETKTFSSYKSLFGRDIKEEIDLSNFKSGRLIFINESVTYTSHVQVNTYRSRTYDLELHTANWKATHLYEFQDYHVAKTIIDLLHSHLGIEVYDEWGEQAAAAIRNRRR